MVWTRGENRLLHRSVRRMLSKWSASAGKTDFGLDGWRDGGLLHHGDDAEGCATMRKRYEGVKSPGAYV